MVPATLHTCHNSQANSACRHCSVWEMAAAGELAWMHPYTSMAAANLTARRQCACVYAWLCSAGLLKCSAPCAGEEGRQRAVVAAGR